jgi:hypothetical protein
MISIQSSHKMDDHDVNNMFSIQDPQKWLTMILLTHMFYIQGLWKWMFIKTIHKIVAITLQFSFQS